MSTATLTPPAVKTKTDKPLTPPAVGEKPAKTPKVKAEAAPADPNAPKKERAPRKDYGFNKDATIRVKQGEEAKFRGQRGEWFARLLASDGKTVQHFLDSNQGITNKKGNPEPPRGWLRAFVEAGACTLEGGTKSA